MADDNLSKTLPLPTNRDIFLSEEVTEKSMVEITKRIIEINAEDAYFFKLYNINNLEYKSPPIKIYIDSPGGAVYNCFGLLSIMDKSKTSIHTIVTGHAMSCGFMILIHGHKRFAYELATPLYHQVSGGAYGETKSMEERMTEVKRLQKKVEELTFKKTKITKERLQKVYESKIDWYMTAQEALKLGVVDEII